MTFVVHSLARRSAHAIAILAVLCTFSAACTSQTQAVESPSHTLIWNVKQQGAYVTSLLRDSQGRMWAATENNGLWMSDAKAANGWRGFNASNSGIGDNSFYTLAEDKQGRIWAGTLNHGVSVFNGTT